MESEEWGFTCNMIRLRCSTLKGVKFEQNMKSMHTQAIFNHDVLSLETHNKQIDFYYAKFSKQP
jgi:hypothetical protein